MAHDVFISYSSKDKPIADAICARLEAAGIRCWIAPRDIAAGEDWPAAIAQAISQGQALVLVFSAHSNSSEEVGRELFLAADHKLVIIPFKIDDVEPEPGKQYYLARTHWLDALNPPTLEQIQNLVDCVKTLVPLRAPAIPENQTQIRRADGGGNQPSQKRLGSPWFWLIPGLGIPIGIVLIGLLGWAAFSLLSKSPAASLQPTQQPSLTAALPPTLTPTIALTFTPSIAPTLTSTIAPTPTLSITATIPQKVPPGTTVTAAAGVKTVNFKKVYISEPFNDNSLEWPTGEIVGPYWLGTREIEKGLLNWDGTSEVAIYSHVSPEASDKQDYLSDQQVSTRVNLVNQQMNGGYGLFIRGSSDESSFYAFLVGEGQFTFKARLQDGSWKPVIDWQTSPYITSTGWNTMMIQAIENHFRLFFNDHLLAEADDASLPNGKSGIVVNVFAANEKIQVQFDDFEVLLPYP